ncbi:ATP-binding cassette domain-containing protein [Atopobiaceae bacterium 24-176]
MQLELSHVFYTYPGGVAPALADVSTVFPVGWTGLIGDNGCGKTTLASIAAGLIVPDAGFCTGGLSSAFCPQDASQRPAGLEEFCCDWSGEAVEARRLLGVDDAWGWRWDELSGGQQKRLQVACALWSRPDVLVMDEPTNDLDRPSREALARALAVFDGVGILISHDRRLLDGLVAQCLVCSDGQWVMRPGGYTAAAGQERLERLTAERARARAKGEVAQLEAEARRRAQVAASSAARMSRASVDPGDHDAKGRIGLAILTGKDGVSGRASATMDRRLKRAKDTLAGIQVSKRYEGGLQGFGRRARTATVAHVPEGEVLAGDFSLTVPGLWVGSGDRVGVSGPNGAGKSVLVRRLVEGARAGGGCLYVPQEVDMPVRAEVLERLRSLGPADAGAALSLVARLHSRPDRLISGDDASPGETRKLMLALGLLADPSLLVLDEPTNHLDVASIEALQGMLEEFPGAVVVVSHDAVLLDAVSTVRWEVVPDGPGRSHVQVG